MTMLRRKNGNEERLRRRPHEHVMSSTPQYENVEPIGTNKHDHLDSERMQRLEAALDKKVNRIIDKLINGSSIHDFAKINDEVLRFVLKMPAGFRSDSRNLQNVFSKMVSGISRKLSEKKGQLMREGADRQQMDRLDGAINEWGKRGVNLESSVLQLVRFIESRLATEPDTIFATGISLDVDYGIDMIALLPTFDEQTGVLRLDVDVLQAKAAKRGLTDEEIRALPDQYHQQTADAQHDIVIDSEWIRKRLLADRRVEVPLPDFDTSFKILDSGNVGAALSTALSNIESPDPFKRFNAEMMVYETLQTAAEDFGADNPMPRPQIELGEIEFRYLVDSQDGLVDLSETEARNYGMPAQAAAK